MKRDDLLHPFVSGNKIRKLKYNIETIKKNNYKRMLTFGGAFSNHLAAVAFAGFEHGFETIGVVRGEELADQVGRNPTLRFAQQHGMKLEFVSREQYRNRNNLDFIKNLQNTFEADFYLPEGGTNELAIKGCAEILLPSDQHYDYICCSMGTGGTVLGLIEAAKIHQTVIGFSALQGNFLPSEIASRTHKTNWMVDNSFHFGGYGKVTDELILFINNFKTTYQIQLDPVYTGKMMFGVFEKIKNNE